MSLQHCNKFGRTNVFIRHPVFENFRMDPNENVISTSRTHVTWFRLLPIMRQWPRRWKGVCKKNCFMLYIWGESRFRLRSIYSALDPELEKARQWMNISDSVTYHRTHPAISFNKVTRLLTSVKIKKLLLYIVPVC